VAYELGTTASSDAYYLAFVLPTVLYNLGGLPFSLWVTARLAAEGSQDEARARAFYGRSVWRVFGIGLLCLLLVDMGAPVLMGLYAPGLEARRVVAGVAAARIGSLAIPALGLQAVSNGKLFARTQFTTAYGWLAASGVVGLSVVAVCTPTYGASGAVLGFVSASWVAALGALWSARDRTGPPRQLGARVLSDDFGVGVLFRAVTMQLFFQGSLLMVYGFGSALPAGQLAASLFASKVQTAVYESLVVTGGVLVYPRIAESLHVRNHRAVWNAVVRALNWLFPASAAIAVLLMACRTEIVTLIYERHAFDDRSVLLVSNALLGFAPGILGLTIVEILHRAMVLRGRIAGYGVVFGVSLAVDWAACRLLVSHLGVMGITLGTSIGTVAAAVGLLVYAVMRLHMVSATEVLALVGRTLAGAVLGLAVLVIIRARAPLPRTVLGDLLFVGVGAATAVAILWVVLGLLGHQWTGRVVRDHVGSELDRP
jgi:putative peptidoglycan lipid II flippase